PSPAHPGIERDKVLGRLRQRMRHQQKPCLAELRRIGDADRNDPVATLERLQRGRAVPADREILAENQRQACQQEQGRPLSGRSRRQGRWWAKAQRRRRGQRRNERSGEDQERARPRTNHFFLAVLLLVVSLEPPGATPSSASGSFGSLLVACCVALVGPSWLDRVMIEPMRTSRKANASPVSPMRMR